MPEAMALITVEARVWSAWSPHHKAVIRSAQARAREGHVFSPETFGGRKADYAQFASLFYEVLFYEVQVESIGADEVSFAYRNLVVENPGGGLNLFGPYTGSFVLRAGQSRKLGTASMDAGTRITVTLDGIG